MEIHVWYDAQKNRIFLVSVAVISVTEPTVYFVRSPIYENSVFIGGL